MGGLLPPGFCHTDSSLNVRIPTSHRLLPAGQTVVATLTFEVADVPGTYQLTLFDGKFLSADMRMGAIATGPGVSIIVPAD